MTQKQFSAAIQLHHRLERLYRAKKEIEESTTGRRLSYIKSNADRGFGYSGPEWSVCDVDYLAVIGPIFDKHDEMIRKEIDEEIEALKKEIETL